MTSGPVGDDTVVGVHVGVHKTGTSALQAYLTGHRRTTLLRHRVAYLRRRDIGDCIGPWGDELAVDPGPLAARLRGLAAPRWTRTVLASDEDIVGRPFAPNEQGRLYPAGPANLAALGRALHGLNARLVLTLRTQHEFLESYYLQTVHQGRHYRFQDWYARIDPATLSWRPLVDAARAAVGARRVAVVDFAAIRKGQEHYIERVLRTLDPRLAITVSSTVPQNRSLSARGLEIALAVNPLLETEAERRAIRLVLQEHFPNTLSPRPVLLSDDQRAALVEQYGDEYAELVGEPVA